MALTKFLKRLSTFALGTLLVQLAVLARDLIVARELGLSPDLDDWTLIWAGVTFVMGTFSGSSSGFLVPLLQNYFIQDQYPKDQLSEFRRNIFKRASLVCLILVIFEVYSFNWLPNSQQILLISTGVGLVFVNIFIAFERTSLQALQKVGSITFSPLISVSLSLLVFSLLFSTLSAGALAIGLVIGFVAEGAFLRYRLTHSIRHLSPSSNPIGDLSSFWGLVYAGALTAAGALLDQLMLANILSEGNSALSYGGKLSSAVISFLGGLLALVIFPSLSRSFSESKNFKSLRPLVLRVAGASLIIAFTLFIAGGMIINWLFLGGKFSDTDAALVTQIHQILIWHIPFYLIGALGLQVLQILGLGQKILKIAAAGLIFKVFLNYLLGKTWGPAGFAFSTLGFYSCTCLLIWLTVGKQKLYWGERS